MTELAKGTIRPTHFSAVSVPSFAANKRAKRGATFSHTCFPAKSLP